MTELAERSACRSRRARERVRRLERERCTSPATTHARSARAGAVAARVRRDQALGEVGVIFDEFERASCPHAMLECHLVSGDFDYLIKARNPEMNAYRRLLGDCPSHAARCAGVEGYIVMEEIVERLELVRAIPGPTRGAGTPRLARAPRPTHRFDDAVAGINAKRFTLPRPRDRRHRARARQRSRRVPGATRLQQSFTYGHPDERATGRRIRRIGNLAAHRRARLAGSSRCPIASTTRPRVGSTQGREDRALGRELDDTPIHHATRSLTSCTTEVVQMNGMRSACGLALQLAHQLSTCACTDTSSAEATVRRTRTSVPCQRARDRALALATEEHAGAAAASAAPARRRAATARRARAPRPRPVDQADAR